MFCDGCGTTINAGTQYCQRCGKPIMGATSAGHAEGPIALSGDRTGRVQRNIEALATLWIAFGVLRFVSIIFLVILRRFVLPFLNSAPSGPSGGGSQGVSWNLNFTGWLFPFGVWFGGILIPVLGSAYLFLGWGLHQRKPWARVLGLVLGFLVLLQVPFGTALGVFTIWVLLPDASGREYDGMARG